MNADNQPKVECMFAPNISNTIHQGMLSKPDTYYTKQKVLARHSRKYLGGCSVVSIDVVRNDGKAHQSKALS